jgi:lysophospholipase L1-like esterase
VPHHPNVSTRCSVWCALGASLLLLGGCGSDSTVQDGSGAAGGSSGASGAPSSGGTSAAAAGGTSAGSGGTTPTGGTSAGGAGGASAGSAGLGGGGTDGGGTGGGAGEGGTSASGGTAGTGGNAGSGGTGGDSGEYRPCPTDGSPCKILPLGDSITWGFGDEQQGGYRGPLFKLAVEAQQKITFTGSLTNGPDMVLGQAFPKRNEGHQAWTIATANQWSGGTAGIAGLIPSPAFDDSSGGTPHIILMMIGTNDITANSPAQTMASHLGALVDKITNAAPNALLVVAKITPVPASTDRVNQYNSAIEDIVEDRAKNGKHVELGDMNTGFNNGTMLLNDNLHPNRAGYEFMASRWYEVIGSRLPK